jgi:hypothetical protein
LASRPRWQPRTKERPYNLLRVEFKWVGGDPRDYFVMAQNGSKTGIQVSGCSDLSDSDQSGKVYEARIYLAFSPLTAPAERAQTEYPSHPATPAEKKTGLDPHLITIALYRKRSIAGLPLPPIPVGTYGLQNGEFPQESQ